MSASSDPLRQAPTSTRSPVADPAPRKIGVASAQRQPKQNSSEAASPVEVFQAMADQSPRHRLAGALRGVVTQRVEEKNAKGEWVRVDIDFSAMNRQQVAEFRSKIYSLLTPDGIYKLSSAEMNVFNRHASELEKLPEALAERAVKAAADDRQALENLGKSLTEPDVAWRVDGAPSRMGDSASHGFSQNWELAILVAGQRAVLHLHFNTNDKKEVSLEKLGRAHIKTSLQSRAGNVPAPGKMVEEAIALIARSTAL
nr:hypothetical protein [uncultured Roseateles sp.]